MGRRRRSAAPRLPCLLWWEGLGGESAQLRTLRAVRRRFELPVFAQARRGRQGASNAPKNRPFRQQARPLAAFPSNVPTSA